MADRQAARPPCRPRGILGVLGYFDGPLAFGASHLATSIRTLRASSLSTGQRCTQKEASQLAPEDTRGHGGARHTHLAEGPPSFSPCQQSVWPLHTPLSVTRSRRSAAARQGDDSLLASAVRLPRSAGARLARERTGATLVCWPQSHRPPAREPAEAGLLPEQWGLAMVVPGIAFPTGLAAHQKPGGRPQSPTQACWPPGDPVLLAEGDYL